MRKIFLLGFLSISFFTNAQFVKGTKYLGGTFSLSSQNTSDSQYAEPTNDIKVLSLNPVMGFLLSENFSIGGQLGYTSFSQENKYGAYIFEYSSKSLSAGIFAQRYFNISDKFLFSLVGEFNFSRGFDLDQNMNPFTGEIEDQKTQKYNLATYVRPSFIFFPAPKWGFEGSIGSIGHTFTRNLSTDEKVNGFFIDYGTVSFGVTYYFLKANQ